MCVKKTPSQKEKFFNCSLKEKKYTKIKSQFENKFNLKPDSTQLD